MVVVAVTVEWTIRLKAAGRRAPSSRSDSAQQMALWLWGETLLLKQPLSGLRNGRVVELGNKVFIVGGNQLSADMNDDCLAVIFFF